MNIEAVHFYFVWTKKGRPPRFCHTMRSDAEAEAQRLAIANPGKKYIVLQALSKFSTEPEDVSSA